MKYTEEYVKQLCEEHDLIFVNICYQTTGTKKRRCVSFICKKHKEYGIQIRPVEKLNNKNPCQYCNHSLLKDTFKDEIYKLRNDIDIIGNYTRIDDPIECKCKIHDYIWYPIAKTLFDGVSCPICSRIKAWNTRGRITTEEFKKRMLVINPYIEIIGEYTGTHNFIKCRCKIHNIEWESNACNILNQTAKCPECAYENQKYSQLLSEDEFLKRLNEIVPHIKPISQYEGMHNTMMFYCTDHDIQFMSTPNNFLHKNGRGCPFCNQSSGERKLCNLLKNKGRKIITQKTFDGCSYIHALRFDVYDIENNIVYEYQGEQHYHPVDFNGDKEKAHQEYEVGLIRDSIKEQYCKENSITLIKIPYWDYDNMEKYII